MNILIPPIANAPRICDECPEADCTSGYTQPSCPGQCIHTSTCNPVHTDYNCSAPNSLVL